MICRIPICFCLLISLVLFAEATYSAGQEKDTIEKEDEWSLEIVRETSENEQEVVLNISVKGTEKGTQSTFRNSIYKRDIDPSAYEDTMTAFTFFENGEGWTHAAEIQGFQQIQLNAIHAQFREKLKNLVQSKLSSKTSEDINRWKLTDEQTAEISKELVPLELATEMLALNVLLPHQQRMVLKKHFTVLGWKSLDSVYGNVALGLSEKQKGEIEKVISAFVADRKKNRQSSLKSKKEIDRRLWEMVLEELKKDQQERLLKFRESYINRLRNRTHVPNDSYEIDGVVIRVFSGKQIENGILVGEPCQLGGSVSGISRFRNFDLYDHSLKGFGLDKLPIVDNQRYLLGIDLDAKAKNSIESISSEFLKATSKYIKANVEKSRQSGSLVSGGNAIERVVDLSVNTQVKMSFRECSSKCFEVLDKTQRQILLENRFGFELFRRGISVFESKIFCKQLDIDESQQSKIRELIKRANKRLAEVDSFAEKTLKELDDRVEREIAETVTQEQLEILDEIR